MKHKKEKTGMAAALTANLIFGFSFIFSKLALTAAHPLIILSARFTIAFAVLNALLLTGKIKISLKGKPKTGLLLMSLMQPLLYFIFELYGLSLVSSALSGIIIALVPVGVMLLSGVLLSEKPTVLQWICTAVSVAGVALLSVISNDGAQNRLKGILLLVCAVLCSSVFNILSRREAARFSPFERTYIMFLSAAVGFNALSLAVLKKNYISELLCAAESPSFAVAMLYLAVLSSVAAFMLYNYSTTVLSVVRTSSFSSIITVVTVLAGVLILGENMSPLKYLLCGLIIIGVWGVNIFTRENYYSFFHRKQKSADRNNL